MNEQSQVFAIYLAKIIVPLALVFFVIIAGVLCIYVIRHLAEDLRKNRRIATNDTQDNGMPQAATPTPQVIVLNISQPNADHIALLNSLQARRNICATPIENRIQRVE